MRNEKTVFKTGFSFAETKTAAEEHAGWENVVR